MGTRTPLRDGAFTWSVNRAGSGRREGQDPDHAGSAQSCPSGCAAAPRVALRRPEPVWTQPGRGQNRALVAPNVMELR